MALYLHVYKVPQFYGKLGTIAKDIHKQGK